MKTLGMIGGTTWVSTQDYYRYINSEVNRMLGGLNSAKLVLYSINFQEAKDYVDKKDYESMKILLMNGVRKLVAAGVDGIMLCANTMHKYAKEAKEVSGLPLIHIADVTAVEINKQGLKTVGLLGTKITMEEPFYKDNLKSHGITAIVPEVTDQAYVNRIIFDELGKDVFREETRQKLLSIMEELHSRGAKGIILGCTEIPLIIKPEHTSLPLFDTLYLHARAAAKFIAES